MINKETFSKRWVEMMGLAFRYRWKMAYQFIDKHLKAARLENILKEWIFLADV